MESHLIRMSIYLHVDKFLSFLSVFVDSLVPLAPGTIGHEHLRGTLTLQLQMIGQRI